MPVGLGGIEEDFDTLDAIQDGAAAADLYLTSSDGDSDSLDLSQWIERVKNLYRRPKQPKPRYPLYEIGRGIELAAFQSIQNDVRRRRERAEVLDFVLLHGDEIINMARCHRSVYGAGSPDAYIKAQFWHRGIAVPEIREFLAPYGL